MITTMQETLEPGIGRTKRIVEEVVELVAPPSADAAQLFKFVCQLEERFSDYASIMHTVGCWDQGTVVTMSVQPTALVKLLERLANMAEVQKVELERLTNIAEVQKVEEEPLANSAFLSLPKTLGVLSRPSISPSKRMRVSLQEVARKCC